MAEKETNVFKDNDIAFADFVIESGSRFGSDIMRAVKEFQVGAGAVSFNANESGIWLGGKRFADAPFSVDMHGHVIAGSIALVGYIPTAGAAADINNNTTLINGGKIVTGSINASSMVVGSLRQVFTSTPTTPYAVGDLWSAGSGGDLKRCITARTTGAYNAADWDLASKYTDDSNTTTIIGNTVTTGFLNAIGVTTGSLVVGTNVNLGTAFASASAGALATLNSVGASQINDAAVGLAKLGSTVIVGGYIKTSLLTADNIVTGTLSSILIQTSTSANTGVKMSSALNGIVIYGQNLEVRGDAGSAIPGELYGSIGGYGGYFNISAVNGRNMLIGAADAAVFFNQNVYPLTTAVAALGSDTYRWNNVFTYNLDINGGNYYLNYYSTKSAIRCNSNFHVAGTLSLTGNLVFDNDASITIGGRAYYQTTGAFDSSKYYLRS